MHNGQERQPQGDTRGPTARQASGADQGAEGQSLARFVAARKKAVAACDAPPDTKAAARAKLDFVAAALGRTLYYIHRMIDERWHGLPRPRDHREWLRMTLQERHEHEPCGATVRRWLRRWGFDRAAVSNWVKREKDLRYLDARYPQLFRYPPALDIPADLTRYRNMQPRPLLRGSRLASYADWAT